MKSISVVCLAILASMFFTGCLSTSGQGINAGLMMGVQGPVLVGDTSVSYDKIGVSKAEGYVLFAQGDASIKAAMDQAGITKIHHVDYEVTNYLGVYAVWKTIVYGE